MSIKIHQGFSLDPVYNTVQGLHHLVSEFRSEVKPLAERYLLGAFIKDAVTEFDRRHVGLNSQAADQSPCSRAWNLMLDAQAEIRKGHRHPAYDASCSMALLPHPDGRILGILYTENEEWFHLWMTKPGVGDYGYWDNSDRPDEVSDSAWSTRRADWETVLLQYRGKTPSLSGFTAEIHDEGFPPSPEALTTPAVEAALPSLRQRAARLAQETIIVRPPEGPLTIESFMEQLSAARRDGRMEAEIDRLASLLVDTPTVEMLRA